MDDRVIICEATALRESVLPRTSTDALLKGTSHLGGEHLSLPAEAELVGLGDAERRVGVLLSGWAFRYRRLALGRRQILDILLPGDLFGLEGIVLGRSEHAIRALTEVSCRIFDPSHFRRVLAQDAAFSSRLVVRLLRERRRLHGHLASLGRCDAGERLARFMLQLRARLRARGLMPSESFRLPMTQLQLGDHLGLTVIHVNRTLRRLRDAGIITMHDRLVVIRDLDRLRQLACLDGKSGQTEGAIARAAGGGEAALDPLSTPPAPNPADL